MLRAALAVVLLGATCAACDVERPSLELHDEDAAVHPDTAWGRVTPGDDTSSHDGGREDVATEDAPGVDGADGTGGSEVSVGDDTGEPIVPVLPETCDLDEDCAVAGEGACAQARCEAGVCAWQATAAGTACGSEEAPSECAAAVCDGLGSCVVAAAPAGSACRLGDWTACERWECAAGGCVAVAEDCDDGLACTEDDCLDGACRNRPRHQACDDASVCTVDTCDGEAGCVNTAVACDDGNPCTADTCDPAAGCVHVASVGAACDDGNPCTAVDTCLDGWCVGLAPTACDDGNPCTDDACDPATGACAFVPNTAPCADDGQACTADVCAAGVCTHPPAPSGTACTDGNACTAGDRCVAGSCQWKQMLSCSDGNPCTLDSCDPLVGCLHVVSPACSVMVGIDSGDPAGQDAAPAP